MICLVFQCDLGPLKHTLELKKTLYHLMFFSIFDWSKRLNLVFWRSVHLFFVHIFPSVSSVKSVSGPSTATFKGLGSHRKAKKNTRRTWPIWVQLGQVNGLLMWTLKPSWHPKSTSPSSVFWRFMYVHGVERVMVRWLPSPLAGSMVSWVTSDPHNIHPRINTLF